MVRRSYLLRFPLSVGLSMGVACASIVGGLVSPGRGAAATIQKRYYAHAAVHDKHGVIAPWYKGQNGQIDFRLRIAAETLKRYPWVEPPAAASAAPHYVFNGHWKIDPDGKITPIPINDWANGDLGQRAAYILSAMVDYYRYSGDPAAIAIMTLQADALLDHCCTPADHPWPNFLISVPIKGKPYGKCDPKGMIQLDIVAEVGVPLLRAYQITGNQRWFEAAKHWGDLMAAKRNRTPGAAPWGRYANPESAPWKDVQQTGGVAFLAYFFDELIRLGHTGKDNEIVQARDAARAYLRDVLLPAWTVNDTWGRNYWDWNDPVQAENVTEFAARYMMDNKEAFPNWRNDARNILSLFLNHTSVDPNSGGEVYSGAWAYPESSSCCERSLWYGPMELAVAFAQYGVEAQSVWARELARRMQILATYDGHETGVSEDNIDGGFIVNNAWFKIAHPMALKHLLATIAWMPEEFAPPRENHIVNSTSVVSDVGYADRMVEYTTFDAPPGTIATLRVKSEPEAVLVPDAGQRLPKRDRLEQNGYTVKPLGNGDALVRIRHDGIRRIAVVIPTLAEDSKLSAGPLPDQPQARLLPLGGKWTEDGPFRVSDQAGSSATAEFVGNQVRVLGNTGPDGGLAEVYLDGVKQLVGIDCWNPSPRKGTLFYRNGLSNTKHTLKILVLGKKNPVSKGAKVYLGGVEWSAATGTTDFGEGGGPTDAQRMVFGYTGREDIKDSAGNLWRPGTEFVVRLGHGADSVASTWWTTPSASAIAGTPDPELYRYGVHAKEFIVNVTVGPGKYHARLKFAAARGLDTNRNCITLAINGKELVKKMDVVATAGGPNRAVDLVFNDIEPRNGVIDFRFTGGDPKTGLVGEAFVQAIEVGPGDGGVGATPVCVAHRNLLRNPGFEDGDAQTASFPAQWKHEGDSAAPQRETAAAKAMDAQPEVAEGADAVRIVGKGRCRLSQEIAVRPNSPYRASVVVKGRDAGGKGFGRNPGDSAALVLEELDAAGKLVARTSAIPKNSEVYLATAITTKPDTAKIRFVLDATQGCDPKEGSVTFDACVLDGPPAPAAITGTVTDERKNPLAGALVTAGERSVRAGPDGKFNIPGFEDLAIVSLQVAKQGHYAQARVVQLNAGDNRFDLILAPLPTNNLLINGDFEQGFAAARSMEHGTSGQRGPWTFQFSPGVACYIYPESIYEWRPKRIFRGKEAISHVTDGGGELRLWQDVAVDPNTELTASAWVQGLDVQQNGKGFGAAASDFAGLLIEELDAQGRVLRQHEKAGIRKSTPDFQRVSTTFTTGPNTAKVRYTLYSHIHCIWQQGAAIFDDGALEKAQAKK